MLQIQKESPETRFILWLYNMKQFKQFYRGKVLIQSLTQTFLDSKLERNLITISLVSHKSLLKKETFLTETL